MTTKSTNKKLHRQTMRSLQHIVCKGSGNEFQRNSFQNIEVWRKCIWRVWGAFIFWLAFCSLLYGLSPNSTRHHTDLTQLLREALRMLLNSYPKRFIEHWLTASWLADGGLSPLYLWITSPKLRQANLSLLQLTTDWLFPDSCFEFVSCIYL